MVISWWSSFPLDYDLGNSWKFKLQFFRQKLRGWNANLIGVKRRLKSSLLEQIATFELQQESQSLFHSDYSHWQECQFNLHKIYKEEEIFLASEI